MIGIEFTMSCALLLRLVQRESEQLPVRCALLLRLVQRESEQLPVRHLGKSNHTSYIAEKASMILQCIHMAQGLAFGNSDFMGSTWLVKSLTPSEGGGRRLPAGST